MPAEAMLKRHYVYEYWTPDTNECFYVGKGVAGRSDDMKNRNAKFELIVKSLAGKKLEPIVKITYRFETNREARLKESQRILYFIRKGHPLVNHQYLHVAFLLRPRGRTKPRRGGNGEPSVGTGDLATVSRTSDGSPQRCCYRSLVARRQSISNKRRNLKARLGFRDLLLCVLAASPTVFESDCDQIIGVWWSITRPGRRRRIWRANTACRKRRFTAGRPSIGMDVP
jgi:hypothetical protein